MMVVDEHFYMSMESIYSLWILRGKPFPKGIRFGTQSNQFVEVNDIDIDDINFDVSGDSMMMERI